MAVFTFDLHTHLLEKNEKPERYWNVVKAKKIDVVAVTEHMEENPKLAYEKLLEKKPRNKVLIPGIELNTEIGHVMAFGSGADLYEVKEFFNKGESIKNILRIAEENDFLVSIAHPWGFSYDSAAYIVGEKRLERFVQENFVGVEVYNGMVGSIGNFVFGTNWVRKPLNFFDFMEKNKVARKTRLDRVGKKLKKKLDKKSREVTERCTKPIDLGEKARFITAGSDAHSAERIGTGVLKVKSAREKLDVKKALDEITKKKNVVWAGPFVQERADGSYKVSKVSPHKMEMIKGLKYATISKIKKKIKGKEKK